MKVLITGGAGFIGSTIASACIDAGHVPVLLDNLVTGRAEFTRGRIFYHGDVADGVLVDRIFRDHPDIALTIHCAALIVVPESVGDPIRYYDNNVSKSIDLAAHLVRNGCTRLIFSSTAAFYQADETFAVDETSTIAPRSPYARSKAICEQVFTDIAAAEKMRILSLRYFNPIGTDPYMRTGLQLHRPNHALGRMLLAHARGEAFQITGTDYPTRDGSGIRDYIHVWDLAEAHVRALETFDYVMKTHPNTYALNVGTGSGTTVRELAAALAAVTGRPLHTTEVPRRPGDVVGAYTRIDRVIADLGWRPELSLEDGIRHSLQWLDRRSRVIPDLADPRATPMAYPSR